jgi:hypothetical protein
MTADDTTADRDAAPADPGHETRELLRVGWDALTTWIAHVLTPRRRLTALVVGIATGVIVTLLLRALLLHADDSDGDETVLAAALGLVIGAVAGAVPLTTWLSRASRRIRSATGAHPHWRDAALLDRSVDARGRVALAPGTAERIAVESRRAIASSAVGVPGALILLVTVLIATPVVLLQGTATLERVHAVHGGPRRRPHGPPPRRRRRRARPARLRAPGGPARRSPARQPPALTRTPARDRGDRAADPRSEGEPPRAAVPRAAQQLVTRGLARRCRPSTATRRPRCESPWCDVPVPMGVWVLVAPDPGRLRHVPT